MNSWGYGCGRRRCENDSHGRNNSYSKKLNYEFKIKRSIIIWHFLVDNYLACSCMFHSPPTNVFISSPPVQTERYDHFHCMQSRCYGWGGKLHQTNPSSDKDTVTKPSVARKSNTKRPKLKCQYELFFVCLFLMWLQTISISSNIKTANSDQFQKRSKQMTQAVNEWMNESTKLCSDLTELPDRYPLRNPLVPFIVLGSVNNQKEVKVLAWTLLFKSSQVYLYSAFPNISQQQTQNVALTLPNGPMRFFWGGNQTRTL